MLIGGRKYDGGMGEKITTLEEFEKHLKRVYPHHFAPIYTIVASHSSDREAIVERLRKGFCRLEPSLDSVPLQGPLLTAEKLSTALYSQSLFSGKSLLLIDEIEKIKKGELKTLSEQAGALPEGVRLILSGSSLPAEIASLKEGVVLDLSKEKPWDRKSRLARHLTHLASRARVSFSHNAAEFLVERVGDHVGELERECEKLICFVGEGKEITLEEIKTLVSLSAPIKRYKVSQEWVFSSPNLDAINDLDMKDSLLWLGLIRSHLQKGLKMATLIERGETPQKAFGDLNPKEYNFLNQKARALGTAYFETGLKKLIAIEFQAKGGAYSDKLLLQLLIGELDNARKTHTAA